MTMGRKRAYIVLGYNDYDLQSHQWYITPDLSEALSLKRKWEAGILQVQIRFVGDVIDNPLSDEAIDIG